MAYWASLNIRIMKHADEGKHHELWVLRLDVFQIS